MRGWLHGGVGFALGITAALLLEPEPMGRGERRTSDEIKRLEEEIRQQEERIRRNEAELERLRDEAAALRQHARER